MVLIGTTVWVLVAVPKGASQTPVLSGLVLLPIGGGLFGGGAGFVISLPFVGLWCVMRAIGSRKGDAALF